MTAQRCDAIADDAKGVRFDSQSEWGRKWNKSTLTYSMIRDSEDIPKQAEERKALNLAMTTWDIEIPLKLQWVRKDENPDITVVFKTSDEEQYFKDRPSTLAFAYYPDQGAVSGKIVFNEDYRWSLDGENVKVINPDDSVSMVKTYNIIQVLIHEIGHSIGLTHDEHSDTNDVMDPYYNGEVLDLSDWDLYRIRQIYGTRIWKWSLYGRVKNWLFHRKRRY